MKHDTQFYLEMFFVCVALTVLGLLLPGCERDCNDNLDMGEMFTAPSSNIYVCQDTDVGLGQRWEWVLLEAAAPKPDAGVSAEVESVWRRAP